LDWQDLRKAPVWGSGNLSFGTDGTCVSDGPFAGMHLQYLNDLHTPHCLSRNFAESERLQSFGDQLRPEVVEKLLREPEYDMFSFVFEETTHLATPNIIGGDILGNTAPNGKPFLGDTLIRTYWITDPVWFLHHAQIDRIWWMWQHREAKRARRYGGTWMNASASLNDWLKIRGSPDIKISDVIDTQDGILCYSY
jgi:tyrosinase